MSVKDLVSMRLYVSDGNTELVGDIIKIVCVHVLKILRNDIDFHKIKISTGASPGRGGVGGGDSTHTVDKTTD
jgi:hypothetical protein